MKYNNLETNLPKNAFGPLVDLGIQIAYTLSHLRIPGAGTPQQDRRQG